MNYLNAKHYNKQTKKGLFAMGKFVKANTEMNTRKSQMASSNFWGV